MKRITITTIAALALATSYGQIGGGLLNKAKDKANKTVDKATSTTPATGGSSSGGSSSGSSTSGSSSSGSGATSTGGNSRYHQIQASPAHYEITNIESTLKEIKPKVTEKRYKGYLDGDFDKAQGYIDKIKTKDPNWKVDDYQKELNDLKAQYDGNSAKLDKESQMNWIVMDAAGRATSNFRDGAISKYSYADYMAGRDAYAASPTADYPKMIPDADRYYNEMYPKYMDENFIPEMKKTYMYDFNEDRNKLGPDDAIRGMKENIAKIDKALIPLKPGVPAEAQLKTLRATFEGIQKQYEDFKSSGEYTKFKAKWDAEQLAKVRFPKVVSSNPTWEAAAKKEVLGWVTGAAIQRVGLTTSAWIIKKNDYDLPVYRYQRMTVAFKKSDGKCYMVEVFVQQDYAGGGTWNNGYKYSLDAREEEILCENVNK